MKIFVLEDEIYVAPRNQIIDALKGHDLTIATSFPVARKKHDGDYHLYLLDHDMHGFFENSDNPDTGYQFCRWLVQQGITQQTALLHSHNAVGRRKMKLLLEEHGWKVFEYPFSAAYIEVLRETI